jgi:signal transduction histidine kinase
MIHGGNGYRNFSIGDENTFIRLWVTGAFAAVALLMTIEGFALFPSDIYNSLIYVFPQLFLIPILLIALWFPERSLAATLCLIITYLSVTGWFIVHGTPIDPVITLITSILFLWVVIATTSLKSVIPRAETIANALEHLNIGHLTWDKTSQRIIGFNGKIATITGFSPSQLESLTALDILGTMQEGKDLIEGIHEDDAAVHTRIRFRDHNGQVRAVLVSCTPQGSTIECSIIEISDEMEKNSSRTIDLTCELKQILDSSLNAIVILSTDGTINRFHWSRLTEKGISPQTFIGRKICDLFNNGNECISSLNTILATKRPATFTADLRLEEDAIPVHATLTPLLDDDEITAVIGSIHEPPQRDRSGNYGRQEGDEAVRWKNFVNVAAHELRTPLQPILGYLNLIMDDEKISTTLDDDTLQMLKICLESAERERGLVDRMLEHGVLDNYSPQLRYSAFELKTLVQSILYSNSYEKYATISLLIPDDTLLYADRDRMYQVVEGIIANAIQYSKDPRIITISHSESVSSHSVRIEDNGKGMDLNEIPHIFEPFFIGDTNALNREFGRMGLGLSIARTYIEMHGGTILVDSAPGKGSTFTIVLPKVSKQD